MKKVFVLALVGFVLFSCKTKTVTSNEVEVSSKVDNSSQVDLKGEWIISSVSYPGSEYISVNSFDIADSKCFIGSTWKFISNNNEGNVVLNKTKNCVEFISPITWFVNKEGQFILKVLKADSKAKKVRSGYVLTLANKTNYSFQLVDKINFGNNATDVIYQFNKSN
ncbi:hypothetical protein [Flavobacterium sp.]|uniref:hypothetical protein n=1 Tax=Flavobacterium sp. TaxID=239 RepID=UPI0038FC0A92